jgi:hypothetical protein
MNLRPALVCLLAALLLPACSKTDPEAIKAELVKADQAFSERSKKDGPEAAFQAFITTHAKLLSNYTEGAEGVRQTFMQFPKTTTLTWEPAYADVSESGDLGYTWGRYTLFVPSPGKNLQPLYRKGTYVTIWRRQSDGSWKVVLDGGNPDGQR